MVTHLLVRGHRLDVFPLAPITRSLNAAMYAVTKRPPWPKGLALLAPHADFDLRTPIYECHILHFTVARLDLALLENVISITRAEAATLRPTALEHTLVHIACLSLDETWINVHAATVYASIHEVPTLSECWKRQSLWPPGLSKLPGPEAEVDTWPRSNFDAHQLAQTNVVIFLFKASIDMITELNKQELYGNRALHYLAAIPLVWETVRNAFGHSAKDLYEDGHSARNDWDQRHMSFWQDPYSLWDGPVETWIDWYTYPGKRFAS
ncbi:hypothetical protein MMC15_001317 [Xylographa vitiligo]|nr:hypothetical protein [Xylographa vitiligo]